MIAKRTWALSAVLAMWCASHTALAGQIPDKLPPQVVAPPPTTGLLAGQPSVIDLATALRLGGVQNPEILQARERIDEAAARRQLAAAQFLPSLNAGTSTDLHTGPLQRSTGQIIDENRGSLYLGLGSSAVGAGTVTIPGLVWAGNFSDTIYANLVSRQRVQQQQFASLAVRNAVLLRIAGAYLDLVRAEGRLAVARKNRGDVAEIARITASFVSAKQGNQADADRAATELEQRNADLLDAEGMIATASARLAQLLSLDPSTRLEAADSRAVPAPLIPDPVPLPELLAIALLERPELRERQAAIRAALLELDAARCLPFSPNLILGYSAGTFGGGSNLVAEGIVQPNGTVLQQNRFGNFGGRQDVDAVVFWSLRNLGVGNLAQVRLAQSNTRTQQFREVEILDRIRGEVAAAFAKTHARLAQIATNERAIQASEKAFQQDFQRTKNGFGLPIEVLDSLRLLSRSRYAYLDAIVDYNQAEFELYVALGQPPADFLARPAVPAGPAGAQEPPMKRILLTCGLLALAGCQTPDGARRSPPSPPLATAAGSRAHLLPPSDPPAAVTQFLDLPTALARAGVDNPSIALAVEAITAGQARQLTAQALLLPTLSAGASFDWHEGNLQSSQGVIENVERQSAYVGGGAAAIGAGTVGVPGVLLVAHLGDAIYEPRAARYEVAGRQFDAQATRNAVLLDVANRYFAVVGAQARREAARQSEADFTEIARLTASFAAAGQGSEADAHRAESEVLLQQAAAQVIEEEEAVAAAELARLLNLDPSIRLRFPAGPVPVLQLVDPVAGLDQLVQMALANRPEIAARSADVAVLETRLQKEKVRPLVPFVAVGFSAGGFGGGGSQADSSFGHFGGRTDFDATAFWSLENFGFGNLAIQHGLRAQVAQASAQRANTIDAVRQEVAEAFALSAARRGEMETSLRRLETSQRAFRQDMTRVKNLQGRPIEVLDSARLLSTARQAGLQALTGYNQAQLQLFVSLGQPPQP